MSASCSIEGISIKLRCGNGLNVVVVIRRGNERRIYLPTPEHALDTYTRLCKKARGKR
jgi:hypothetical protein